MGDFNSKEAEREFLELYINYAAEIGNTNTVGLSKENVDKYLEIFQYMTSPYDREGNYDPKITFDLISAIVEGQVKQYVELGKAKEKIANELPHDPNVSDEHRNEMISRIAIHNTKAGKYIASSSDAYNELAMGIDDNNKLHAKLRKDLYQMAGLEYNGSFNATTFLAKMTEDIKAKVKASLSEEDKRYFEIGATQELFIGLPEDYKKCSKEQMDYANQMKQSINPQTNEEKKKFLEENKVLSRYDNINDLLKNKKETLASKNQELLDTNSFGHSNSTEFQNILDCYEGVADALEGKEFTGKNSVLNGKRKNIEHKKNLMGAFNQLEDALVTYLEDKWKPRKSPIGKKRYSKAIEMLEIIDSEKAKALKDYHALKNSTKNRMADNFATFYKNELVRNNNSNWSVMELDGEDLKETKQVSFKELIAEDGEVQVGKVLKSSSGKSMAKGEVSVKPK